MEWVLLGLIVGVVALGTPVLALIAFLRSGETRSSIEALQSQIRDLRAELARRGPAASVEPQPEVSPAPPQSEAAPVIEPVVAPPVVAAPPPPSPSWQPAPPLVEPVAAPLPPLLTPGTAAAAPAAPAAPRAPKPSLEQWLGARAFVWGGGVVLALAAIFLVRYSIEQGYLSPTVRVMRLMWMKLPKPSGNSSYGMRPMEGLMPSTPQATRGPALPLGWLVRSSTLPCTMRPRPISGAVPPIVETPGTVTSTFAMPLSSASMFPKSPAWRGAVRPPCWLGVGE